jgi:tetratricopeptide (TPR) repeat protein
VRNNFAFLLESAGVPKRALQLHDETLSVLTKRDPAAPPPVALFINRSRSLESLGRFEQARAFYQRGLEVSQARQSTDGQVHALAGLARAAIETGDLVAAEQYAARATQLVGSPQRLEKYPAIPVTLGNLALASGKLDAARQHFERAATNKGNQSAVISAKLGLAEIALRSGESDTAEREARAALQTAKLLQAGLPHSQFAGRAWLMLGRVLQQRGENTQAHQAFADAVSDLSSTVDADHPLLIQARELLAP